MSNQQRVLRDERTVAVENAGLKWACIFVAFALRGYPKSTFTLQDGT